MFTRFNSKKIVFISITSLLIILVSIFAFIYINNMDSVEANIEEEATQEELINGNDYSISYEQDNNKDYLSSYGQLLEIPKIDRIQENSLVKAGRDFLMKKLLPENSNREQAIEEINDNNNKERTDSDSVEHSSDKKRTNINNNNNKNTIRSSSRRKSQ